MEKKRKGRFGAWSAHHFGFVLFSLATWPVVELIFIFVAKASGRTWYIESIPELIFAILIGVWSCWCVLSLLLWGSAMGHFGSMCVKCVEQLPPDAALRAQKWHPLFAFQHKLDRIPRHLMRATRNQVFAWLLVLLTAFSPIVVGVALSVVLPGPWRGLAIITSVSLFALIAGLSFKLHTTFAPWCEYCHEDGWEDDGPEEPSPELPPMPTITKTV